MIVHDPHVPLRFASSYLFLCCRCVFWSLSCSFQNAKYVVSTLGLLRCPSRAAWMCPCNSLIGSSNLEIGHGPVYNMELLNTSTKKPNNIVWFRATTCVESFICFRGRVVFLLVLVLLLAFVYRLTDELAIGNFCLHACTHRCFYNLVDPNHHKQNIYIYIYIERDCF